MSLILTQSATRVRTSGRPKYSDGNEASQAVTNGGELLTAEGLPRLTELVRLGKSYYGKGVVTTKTLNQVAPTTTAASTLWNGNATGGASYVLEGVGVWSDVSGGAANINTLYIEPSIVTSAAAPATAEAGVIRNLRLGGGTSPGAVISQTVTVTDNGWLPIYTMDTAALDANKGIGFYVPLDGMFIIPPLYYVALHVTGTAATAEFGFFYVWHEVQLDLP